MGDVAKAKSLQVAIGPNQSAPSGARLASAVPGGRETV
jgi:hypothetical protein